MARTRRTKNKFTTLARLLSVSAILVLFIGAVVSWRQFNTNSVAQNSSNHHQSGPSTNKPSDVDFDKHQVPADESRFIYIPTISVWAMVKSVGVNSKNQIEAPGNVHETGWYTDSAKPGQDGAILIDGHVSSWETHGVFYDLKSLKSGDEVIIERGDGAKFSYKVVKSQTYPADNVDMQAALTPINPARPGLNLITCAGEVIEDTNEFSERIVVFTEQIN